MHPAITHLRWLYRHPFTRGRRLAACGTWIAWQVGSRWLGRDRFAWIDGLAAAARPGLHGMTANVGIGLAEPEAMGFLLHYLRPGDLFLDVGANAGSYTLLAASRGSRVRAAEPNPLPRHYLERSLALNGLTAEVLAQAISDRAGSLRMDLAQDAKGHVAEAGPDLVTATTLDALAAGEAPALVKIDVEGHEAAVIAGGGRALATAGAAIVESWGDAALHRTLAALGLEPFTYDPLSRRLRPRRGTCAAAQSVVFARDPAAVQARLMAAPAFRLGRLRI